MLDISFGKLFIIGMVGLMVLGPEKMTIAAKTIGRLLSGARAQWESAKRDFENHSALMDLKNMKGDIERGVAEAGAAAQQLSAKAREGLAEARHAVSSMGNLVADPHPLPEALPIEELEGAPEYFVESLRGAGSAPAPLSRHRPQPLGAKRRAMLSRDRALAKAVSRLSARQRARF